LLEVEECADDVKNLANFMVYCKKRQKLMRMISKKEIHNYKPKRRLMA